ncbi:hypothetical protein CEUSTIGMA_g13552.t1 [Chlamydomonas eustigma]|uniref:Elongation factor EFG domain-containing protein n=1 Tax=Chlamydomonas eustigma TaxID=1157962 RepID=A0A250XT52_9CHLO|nr:hypothetical protein CEUSTIGMA_g13552.t1 [Chlamydomonas eustigma]|eukprot:GAX86139.1 hypothetical protein CEUSTIGMA_g13552.t1 [Chlamydomonas eustigma]
MSLNAKTSAPSRTGSKQSVSTPVAGLSAPLCKRLVAPQAQTVRSVEGAFSVAGAPQKAKAASRTSIVAAAGPAAVGDGKREFPLSMYRNIGIMAHIDAGKAPIILEKMDFPDPVIKIAIEPKSKADLEKMGAGLNKLAQEDPSFGFSRDEETNQTVIEGMGELHLEIIVDRLRREFKVECEVGAPQVNYREGISRTAEVRYVHKKQSGGSGQFADVAIRFEPGEPGSGFVFKSEIKGGTVPKEYVPGVLKGLEEMMSSGSLAGFPVVDVTCVLYDGSYHDVDSSALAFQIAARGCFREAMGKTGARLLEPIMKVEVITPEDHMGDVIGDLNSRRGVIDKLDDKPGGMKQVAAFVPLAEMFQYVSQLRGMTKGRAQYSMKLERYEVVPPNIQTEIVSKSIFMQNFVFLLTMQAKVAATA